MQFSKKIIFLTGTRADFGKIKSLISILDTNDNFEVFVFVTGMHLQLEYGFTLLEIQRCNFKNIDTFSNHTHETTMDLTLASTITGFSAFCKKTNPDLIVVHGDRVERVVLGEEGMDVVVARDDHELVEVDEGDPRHGQRGGAGGRISLLRRARGAGERALWLGAQPARRYG